MTRFEPPQPRPPVRSSFVRSSATVGVGFLISGASAYAFLAVTARTLGPARYAPLATFWALAFLVGPGCFSVMEKEATRRISAGLAVGVSDTAVVRHVGEIGLAVWALMVLLALTFEQFIRSTLLDGSWLLFSAFLLALFAMWAQYLAEGVVVGHSRFAAYSAIISGEGISRLGLGVALLALGDRTAGPLGMAVAAAPALSVLWGLAPILRAGSLGPSVRTVRPVHRRDVGRSIMWLLGGSLGASVLVNAGPILAKALAGSKDAALAGRLLSGLVIVRVPLFLYNSAAATALPALAGSAAAQDWTGFGRRLTRLMAAVVAVGVVTTGAAGTIGPAVVTWVFGSSYRLAAPDLAALAGSAAALMVATTLTVAMQALGRERLLCLSWLMGVAVMGIVVAALPALLQRIELGLLFGSLSAGGCMVWVVRRTVESARRGQAAQPVPAAATSGRSHPGTIQPC
jgi:O-antigen/teichoic acid export membrane protein